MNRYSRKRASKGLSENFGPLKRFLRANVGRPWDSVYGEMSAHVHRGNAVQSHVFQHVVGEHGYVELNVFEADGIVWRHISVRGQTEPVRTRHPLHPSFYVCPRTGLLRLAPKKWPNERKLERNRPKLTPITDNLWVAQVGHRHGLRFWVLCLSPMKKPQGTSRYPHPDLQSYDDAWLGKRVHFNVSSWNLRRTDPGYVRLGYWCREAQPISHKEAREYLSTALARKDKAA